MTHVKHTVAVAAGSIILGIAALIGVTSAVAVVTSSPAHAPTPELETYVCIDGGDGLPGWACYLRGDAPAILPGQDYVVTDQPQTVSSGNDSTTEEEGS